MAIYHFSAKVISRANGSSAVAAAAYRSASRLHDERLDRPHDFTRKAGVVHSEILQPPGTPERWQDRASLWNEVEAGEARKDAQLAREIEFAIPREMDQAQGIELARDFVQREFVARGMVADLNVHWDVADDGSPKPHAHVMLSMREATPEGFGGKARAWNATELLNDWRLGWSAHVNARLAELGIDAQIDHRSLKDQGLALEPQNKIGAAGARRELREEAAERAQEHREIARSNGEKILSEPKLALAAITRQQSTFTDHDLARFVHRHSDGKDQFDQVLAAVRTSSEIVRLGRDGHGRERFTSREMLAVERAMEASAARLATRRGHHLARSVREDAVRAASARGLVLSGQQRDALAHVAGERDLAIVIGYAGTGKSAMLGVAREAWEASGYRVRGAALSGMAAENLESGSAIASRTLASWEYAWTQGRDRLSARDLLVIDEAGLVGSRQLARVLDHAQAAGAKVVLVGDAEQLQAIEAGAAFRALSERHGAVELTEIRRQQEAWQRDATRHLATERTIEALAAYAREGAVREHEDRDSARLAVVDGWDAVRLASPDRTQVMLAYTREDVAALNGLARARLQEEGALGVEAVVATSRGQRAFASGDRVMFLRNERSLGVRNGTLGTLEALSGGAMSVRLDDGRQVSFDLKTYSDLGHGYASTIHKAQGVTVDQTHVLASAHMDRHATYVALSRHRDAVTLHYDRESFANAGGLARTLSRERAKDSTLDYAQPFAGRRGLIVVEPAGPATQDVATSLRALARAHADIGRMSAMELPTLPHQVLAMERAVEALDVARPGLAPAALEAMRREPALGERAGRGEVQPLLRAAEGIGLAGDHTPRREGPERALDVPAPATRTRDRGWER